MSNILHFPAHDILVPDIVRAEGCYLYDAAGARWLDLAAGVWCAGLGHGHPRVVEVLREQAASVMHAGFNYSSTVVEAAAAEILERFGFEGGRCVFLCSGSEAVEYGLRIMRQVVERPRIATMADSYFGAYGAASSRTGESWWCDDWLGTCEQCPFPDDCAEFCEHWNAVPDDELGGLLFEPGSSAGLVRFPPAKLIRALEQRVRANGGLVMVNEVTTGLGRTGRWWGHEHYDLRPDLVALGKGLGNGYPVSCLAVNADVVERLGGQPLPYAQSHQNDPLGAAVAREVLRVVRDEGLVDKARAVGARLEAGLRRLVETDERVVAVRARGLMQLLVLRDDALATMVQLEMARRGYLVVRRPGQAALRLDPPLVLTAAEVDGFLGELADVLAGR